MEHLLATDIYIYIQLHTYFICLHLHEDLRQVNVDHHLLGPSFQLLAYLIVQVARRLQSHCT